MSPPSTLQQEAFSPKPNRSLLRRLFPLLVAAVTLFFLHFQFQKALVELDGATVPLTLSAGWLLAAAALYLAGWILQSSPWLLGLRAFGVHAPAPVLLSAYLVSHLGKYVPGKVMVLVIRGGMLSGGAAPLHAVVAISFYETLATMAAAASLGAAVLIAVFARAASVAMMVAAVGIALVLQVASFPSVASVLIARIGKRFTTSALTFQTPSVNWHWAGQFLSMTSWSLISYSFLCSLGAIGAPVGFGPILAAAVAATPLAAAGGFLSAIPGQLFVREALLIAIVAPVVGNHYLAVAGAVVFRLLTLGVEAAVGALLYFGRRRGAAS